ncbi:MAG: cupin domain-containing protein [Actinomycetota bacterium]|nr:cupin domain-containing protein [Actinomycetota bacterium]
MNEHEFRQLLNERGFGSGRAVEYEPNQRPRLHAHDFTALVLVTAGALTMEFEHETRTMAPGQCCEVAAGTLHAECAGPDGAAGILGTDEASA